MEREKVTLTDRFRESISGGVFVIRGNIPHRKQKRVIERFDKTFYRWVIAETKTEEIPITELGWSKQLKFVIMWKKPIVSGSPEAEEQSFEVWQKLVTVTVKNDFPFTYLIFQGESPLMRDSWGFSGKFGTQAIPLKPDKDTPLKWLETSWIKTTLAEIEKLKLPIVKILGIQKVKGKTVYKI